MVIADELILWPPDDIQSLTICTYCKFWLIFLRGGKKLVVRIKYLESLRRWDVAHRKKILLGVEIGLFRVFFLCRFCLWVCWKSGACRRAQVLKMSGVIPAVLRRANIVEDKNFERSWDIQLLNGRCAGKKTNLKSCLYSLFGL